MPGKDAAAKVQLRSQLANVRPPQHAQGGQGTQKVRAEFQVLAGGSDLPPAVGEELNRPAEWAAVGVCLATNASS